MKYLKFIKFVKSVCVCSLESEPNGQCQVLVLSPTVFAPCSGRGYQDTAISSVASLGVP